MTSIDCPATDDGIRVLRNGDGGASNPTPLPVVTNQGSPSTGANITSPDVTPGAKYAFH